MRRMAVHGVWAILLLVLAGAPAGAQQVDFGFKGGLNFADINVDGDGVEDDDTESTTGLNLGLFLQVGIGDVFALRPELLYSERGTETSDGAVQLDVGVDYIEIPLLFVARIPTGSTIRPVVFVGPTLSFEITCEVEGTDGTLTVEEACEDIDDDDPLVTESTEFGLTFGGGVEVDLGGAVLLLDGRYNLGITDINGIENAPESFKNRVFAISAGIGLRVG